MNPETKRIADFLNRHRYRPGDLVTLRVADIAIRKATTGHRIKISNATQCLHILGEAYRGDWSDFDGRELRAQLNQIIEILAGNGETPNNFMDKNNIVEDEKYEGVFKWKE